MSAPPREALPPCVQMTIFDGRSAEIVDAAGCHEFHVRFTVSVCELGDPVPAGDPNRVKFVAHRDRPAWFVQNDVFTLDTDDPVEAEVAYARGCEFVLTGVLP